MDKFVTTPKGTNLPLTNLKGKSYLMVAYRIQWFVEENPNYSINTELPVLTEEMTVARATVAIKDNNGNVLKTATATKRETKADFSDHTEKAETAAIGRALAMLGYGTQFAVADLDEGQRLADSPLVTTKKPLITNGTKQDATTEVNSQLKDSANAIADLAKVANVTEKKSFRKTNVEGWE